MRPPVALTSSGANALTGSVHRRHGITLVDTLYNIGVLLLQPSIESRDVAQRTERHGKRLHSGREGMRFNSAISSILKRSLTWWERKTRKSSDFIEKVVRESSESYVCEPSRPGGFPRGGQRVGRGTKGIKKANKGARGMPVALGGEEGRDKLRKAAVRGKCPVTRGCLNGETRRERSRHLT